MLARLFILAAIMDQETSTQKYKALTKLSTGDFKAFLYDCDGTLADNMGAHISKAISALPPMME
jgi:hypothetical protein